MAEGPPVLGDNGLMSQKFQEALSFHEQGKLSEAERAYREILASDDGHVGSLVHLGMIRLQIGSIEDAIDLFRQAVDRNPNSADAHAGLANALLAQTVSTTLPPPIGRRSQSIPTTPKPITGSPSPSRG
jgi:tetratricopeptide (TPR) repeat protein